MLWAGAVFFVDSRLCVELPPVFFLFPCHRFVVVRLDSLPQRNSDCLCAIAWLHFCPAFDHISSQSDFASDARCLAATKRGLGNLRSSQGRTKDSDSEFCARRAGMILESPDSVLRWIAPVEVAARDASESHADDAHTMSRADDFISLADEMK